jgi:hypothetical protein
LLFLPNREAKYFSPEGWTRICEASPSGKSGGSSRQTNTSVADAILVDAPALEGWYLLLRPAVAIACTTGIRALLFGGLGRRESKRRAIGIARIEWT